MWVIFATSSGSLAISGRDAEKQLIDCGANQRMFGFEIA
jgi:prophage tail gpP-like protein